MAYIYKRLAEATWVQSVFICYFWLKLPQLASKMSSDKWRSLSWDRIHGCGTKTYFDSRFGKAFIVLAGSLGMNDPATTGPSGVSNSADTIWTFLNSDTLWIAKQRYKTTFKSARAIFLYHEIYSACQLSVILQWSQLLKYFRCDFQRLSHLVELNNMASYSEIV